MKNWALGFFLLVSASAFAQRDGIHVDQFPQITVGEKTVAAQAACHPDTAITCIIVFDPVLSKFPIGVMPTRCAWCIWIDYRTPGVISLNGSPVATGPATDCSQQPGADIGAKLNACIAAMPSGGGIADACGITGAQTLSTTVTVNKPVVLFLCNVAIVSTVTPVFSVSNDFVVQGPTRRAVSITASSGGTIFQAAATGTVKHFELNSISAVGNGAGSAMLTIANYGGGLNWSDGHNEIIDVDVTQFGDYPVQLGQSTYWWVITNSRFVDNNGGILNAYAADLRVVDCDFGYLTPITVTNPHISTKGGSLVSIHGNDFEHNSATMSVEDIRLEANSSVDAASHGWVNIYDNKFGPEGEITTRPKIRVVSTGAGASSLHAFYNLNIGPINHFSSSGEGSYAIKIDQPLIKANISGNYFAGYHTLINDVQSLASNDSTGQSTFDCSNRVNQILPSFNGTDSGVDAFTNQGRDFSYQCVSFQTSDPNQGDVNTTPRTIERPELRNRLAASEDFTNAAWVKTSNSSAVSISSISVTANVATVNCSAPCLVATGFPVVVAGVANGAFNGTQTNPTFVSSTQFTYPLVLGNTSSSGGTVTGYWTKATSGITDPFGGTNASRIDTAGLNANENTYALINTTSQTGRFFLTFWAKSCSTSTELQFGIGDLGFNFQGAIPIVKLSSTWKRYKFVYNGLNAGGSYELSFYPGTFSNTSAKSVCIFGAQVSDYDGDYLQTSGVALAKTDTGGNYQQKVMFRKGADIAAVVDTLDQGYLMLPHLYTGAATTAATFANANEVRVKQLTIPYRTIIGHVSIEVTTLAASSHVSCGIYSADGNTKLVDSGTFDSSTAAVKTNTITSVTLNPGNYYYACTTDNATVQTRVVGSDNATTNLLNARTIKKTGLAANASAAGVLPATLGAVTANGTNIPITVVEP